jgi:hypothetical protein
MSDAHSIADTPQGKPAKPARPRPDFPLVLHSAGVWAKKIRGKMHYFGPWSRPDGARKKYDAQRDELHASRKPCEATDGVTVKEAVKEFLYATDILVENGELSKRTWADYKEACDLVVSNFGKGRLAPACDSTTLPSCGRRSRSRGSRTGSANSSSASAFCSSTPCG